MLVTVTYPDGSTQITAKDSEGRVLSVTGTAQPSRFYHYAPRAGEGGLITTIYYGEHHIFSDILQKILLAAYMVPYEKISTDFFRRL